MHIFGIYVVIEGDMLSQGSQFSVLESSCFYPPGPNLDASLVGKGSCGLSIASPQWQVGETFEKRSILFKVKEGENFNHPAQNTKRDRHPYIEVFRGLKFVRAKRRLPTQRVGPRFEPDAAWSRRSHSEGGRLGKRERFSKVSGPGWMEERKPPKFIGGEGELEGVNL